MTDSEAYSIEFKNFVREKSFILTESKEYIPVPKYLEHFEKRAGAGFLYLVSPNLYDLDVLDQFKDKIVFTTFMASQSGRQLFTLAQINETTHLNMGYIYIDKKFYVGFEIYCQSADYFLSFLEENARYEYKEKSKPAGFGFGAASGG